MAEGGEKCSGGRVKYKGSEEKMLEAFMCFNSERKRKARYKLGRMS